MAEPLAGAFAAALRDGRSRYNALFAQARRSSPALTPDAFSAFLREHAAPVVDAAARVAPHRVRQVADAIFELALELVAHDLPVRCPAIVHAWRDLLAEVPERMAEDPLRLAGSITNALYNLAQVPGARPADWIRIMRSLGGRCGDLNSLLDAGRVASWRCGMAQYRVPALARCEELDETIVRTALDVPDGSGRPTAEIVASLRNDPWAGIAEKSAALTVQIQRRVGGFRGFGGPFLRPPRVVAVDGMLLAGDGEQWWTLHADCFGTALIRCGVGPLPASSAPALHFQIDSSGTVQFWEMRSRFDALRDCSSAAGIENTLAVTIPRSHRIYLLAPACGAVADADSSGSPALQSNGERAP